ncbi:MAG: DUF86 domain-containing protein [Desulfobacterales bacterium]
MSQHDDQVYLKHMLDHAREAVEMVAGKTQADLAQHRMLELALIRLVEIIGEAATRIDNELKASNPQVPWREIIGMRNRLTHGYDTVDLKVLWDTIAEDLPPLITDLEKILK